MTYNSVRPVRRSGASDPEKPDHGLDGLAEAIRKCRLCTGLPLGPRPIVQIGPEARILIAGQAPGRKAHEAGVPFDDPSGERLRDWLGIDRDTFYDPGKFAVLPMGFCYPGTGRSGDLPPRPECAPAWRRRVLDRLVNVELTLIIGRHAQQWHLHKGGGRTLTETVANWRRFWPAVCPLPHPSPRNAIWMRRNPWFEDDLLPALKDRVRALLDAGSSPNA